MHKPQIHSYSSVASEPCITVVATVGIIVVDLEGQLSRGLQHGLLSNTKVKVKVIRLGQDASSKMIIIAWFGEECCYGPLLHHGDLLPEGHTFHLHILHSRQFSDQILWGQHPS